MTIRKKGEKREKEKKKEKRKKKREKSCFVVNHPAKQADIYPGNRRKSRFPEAQNQENETREHLLDFERKRDSLCFAGINILI